MNVFDVVRDSVETIPTTFENDDLAKKFLEGKDERKVRSILAELMEEPLRNYTLSVRQKWKPAGLQTKRRVEIAIVDESDNPRALLEVRAMYTFDAVTPTTAVRFKDYVVDDFKKMDEMNCGGVEKIALLVATHPASTPESATDVAYHKQISTKLDAFGNEKRLRDDAVYAMTKLLEHEGEVRSGVLQLGQTNETRMDMVYWLVSKPL